MALVRFGGANGRTHQVTGLFPLPDSDEFKLRVYVDLKAASVVVRAANIDAITRDARRARAKLAKEAKIIDAMIRSGTTVRPLDEKAAKGGAGEFRVELEHYTGTLGFDPRPKRILADSKFSKTSHMANQPAPGQLSVVPEPVTQKEIENTLDAPRRISEAIESFKAQRADTEAELVRSLRKELAAAPFTVERAIEKHKASKVRDEALAAKIETAEALAVIIAKRIEELKRTEPETLKAVLQRKLEQLEKEAAAEQEQAALLKEQIDRLKALLQELERPTAKSRKE